MPARTIPTIAAVVHLAACTAGPSSDDAASSVRDSAGIRIVESHSPVWGETRTVDPQPLAEIGAMEGDGPQVFGNVPDVMLLPGGQIVVTDSYAHQLRGFGPAGQHLWTFGREGDGPDEFRDNARLARYPGDSVAIFDFGLARTLVVSMPPGPSRAIPFRNEGARAPLLGALGSGSFLTYRSVPTERAEAPEWDYTVVLRVDRDGDVWEEVARVPQIEGAWGGTGRRRILAPNTILTAASDGFYWGRTDRYEIHRYDSLGVLRTVIRRPVEPPALSETDQSTYEQATLEALRQNGDPNVLRMYERAYKESEFADTKPLFDDAFVDVDGRLWLSEQPWPTRYETPELWSVFSEDGVWLGDARVPEHFRLYDARGNTLLGVWNDELGVTYVRVYRLRTADPPVAR